jgi:hypothetical protein
MKVRILETISLSKRVLHPGEIVDVPESIVLKLGGRVKPLAITGTGDPKNLPHYCPAAGMWCSSRLPSNNYPTECVRLGCIYHHTAQDATEAI